MDRIKKFYRIGKFDGIWKLKITNIISYNHWYWKKIISSGIKIHTYLLN